MKKLKACTILFSAAGLISCGASSDSAETAATSTVEATRTATGTVEATNVSQLGLTGALAINLPAAVQDNSSSLRLVGQKSIEACLIRESAKQLVTQISMASSLLCHIEAEGNNIPWNKAVILDFSDMEAAAALTKKLALQGPPPGGGELPGGEGELPGGEGELPGGEGELPGGEDPGADPTAGGDFTIPLLGIYADDTDGDNIAVYVCEGEDADSMELSQSFKITGSKAVTVDGESVQASKGIINISMGDDTMGTFKGAIGFDTRYTAEDKSALKLEVKFGFTGFSFSQRFGLTEVDDGVTRMTISETGTMDFGAGDPFSFKNTGIGLFDDENGNVFYSYEGYGDAFSTQACVDNDSYLVDCSTEKFIADGALFLEADSVPKVLKSTFSPAEPSGFDCSAATWTTIKPATDAATIAKHDACDADMMESAEDGGMGDCFSGSDYAQSSDSAEIVFTEEEAGEFEIDPEDFVVPGEEEIPAP